MIIRITDPKLTRHYFKNINKYAKPEEKSNPLNVEFGNGLFMSSGVTWKKHRKLTSKVFHFELIKNRIPRLVEITDEIFAKMDYKGLENVNLMAFFQNITGNVIGDFFFAENFESYKILGKTPTDFIAEYVGILGLLARNPIRFLFGLWPFKLQLLKMG